MFRETFLCCCSHGIIHISCGSGSRQLRYLALSKWKGKHKRRGPSKPCHLLGKSKTMREWLSGRALPCLNEMEGQAQAKMSIKTLPFTWQVNTMREWLSGRALPCQGKCRGFESRLPLQIWYHRQAVRQRSAKPLFPGSNPGGTSKKQGKGS